MLGKVRSATYRQKLFVQLVLIYSLLLSSNGMLPKYLLESIGIDGSFSKGLYTFVISICVLVWLFDIYFFRKTIRVFREKKIWFLPLLFILYVFGVFISNNTDLAMRELEKHMALLLVPLVIISERRVLMINSELIFKFFRIGVVISQLLMLLHASVNAASLSVSQFMYTHLSAFNHPSYVAIGSILSMILAYREFQENRYSKWTVLETGLNLIFIFLYNSKAGIVGFILLLLFVLLRRLTKGWTMPKRILSLFGALLIFGVSIYGVSKVNSRFEFALRSLRFNAVDYQNVDGSTEERRAIWSLTPEILNGNVLFGVGTGDASIRRNEVYSTFGFKKAQNKDLNHHNQFIETLVSTGIIGLFVLIASFIVAFWKSRRNIFSILIMGLFFFNFLFESILEKQAGILLFTCFYGMIWILSKSNKVVVK